MSTDRRSTDQPKPPALAAWLVRHLSVREQAEEVEGDLSELYARNASAHGLARARLHYWREAFGLCIRRSRFGARRHSPHASALAARVHLYWGRVLITLGVVGVLASAAVLALSLGQPKYVSCAAGLLWLAPEPLLAVSLDESQRT
jgi:hypothetical protein